MPGVIIIGKGYGGMSAAALLTRPGPRVIVTGCSALIAGKAGCFADEGGYGMVIQRPTP